MKHKNDIHLKSPLQVKRERAIVFSLLELPSVPASIMWSCLFPEMYPCQTDCEISVEENDVIILFNVPTEKGLRILNCWPSLMNF